MSKWNQIILPFVVVSMLAIKAASAIECYNCDSTQDENCSDIKKKSSSLKPVLCKPKVIGEGVGDWLKDIIHIDFYESEGIDVPMVCQKIIARNEDNNVVVFRGCQLDGGKTNVCETVKNKANKGSVTIESCEICREDACNKSPALPLINLWLLFIPLIILKAFI